MIHFAQPSLATTTWRTLWPGQELRRRGYEVQIEAMDAGYGSGPIPPGATTVLHVTPSLWAHPPWEARVQAIVREAKESGRLVVSLDDDWTRLLELPWNEGRW